MADEKQKTHPVEARMGLFSACGAQNVYSSIVPEITVDLTEYVHDPVMGDAIVRVHEYGHLVTYTERRILFPRHHVSYDHACGCPSGIHCPAVKTVELYLEAGGAPAPRPEAGYFPYVPWACPVCGERAERDNRFNSPNRGRGWTCTRHGIAHYWEVQVRVLRRRFASQPWLYPPIRDAQGQIVYAGIPR